MSDCRIGLKAPKPIHGQIVWGADQRPTPLSYARYVNGVERIAEYIDLDGKRYYPQGGYEEGAFFVLPKPKENLVQAFAGQQQDERAELESLVRDMFLTWKRLDLEGDWPDSGHNGWRVFMSRLAALGILDDADE